MDLEHERNSVDVVRRCQRNWDTTKTIPEEHIQHWIYLATHAPSKQDEAYYNVYVITDRKKLDLLLDHTWGHTIRVVPDVVNGVIRNPQMCANAYFLFTSKNPPTMRNFNPDGSDRDPQYFGRVQNKYMAIGAAMGIVSFSAAGMGYVTGFNKNHGQDNSPSAEVWMSELGISRDETLDYGLGIGWPQPGRERFENDESEYLIGTYPSTKASVHDEVITWQGQQYPNPVRKIQYKPFSDTDKDIKVFRF